MTAVRVTKHIDAPTDVVFARATDLRNAPEVIEKIVRLDVLTDGPIRQGTRFRETRLMFGREATEEMEITSFEPPSGYAVGCESHGCRYHSAFQFRPAATGGTDVEMTFEATPLTFGAKIMSLLMRPMMKAVLNECSKDLDDLKLAIEKSASASTAS